MTDAAGAESPDKFVDMVSATAEVDMRLSDFRPRSALRSERHSLECARFPVIDYQNHLDSMGQGRTSDRDCHPASMILIRVLLNQVQETLLASKER